MISIKEVTKQTGVTVRTLRYYDEIDLLSPAGKTEGGHRLYGEKELIKLQEIQFLQSLGFSLKEIKEMLQYESSEWAASLNRQLFYILAEKEKLNEIESILKGLLNNLVLDDTINISQVKQLIHLYRNNQETRSAYREKFFTNEEQAMLKLLPNTNRLDPHSMEWISLTAQLKQQMHKGEAAPEIQNIIRRMHEKTMETFGDNDELLEKIWEIRSSPEKSQKMGFYPIEQEVIDFFEKASKLYVERQNGKNE